MALQQKNPVETSTGKRRVGSQPPKLPPQYDPPKLDPPTDIPHPDVTERTSEGMGTREITLTTPKGKVTLAYGKQRLAGKIQYFFKSGRDLFIVKELCLGECDSLVAIDAGAGEITTPFIFNANFQFWFYPGTPAGQVDPNLVAVDATWNEAFPGVCYVVEKYSNVGTYWSDLLNTVYVVKARKCLDSSNPTGPRIYSENVWDQWFDYVQWSEGKALPASRVNAASFASAKAADIAATRSMDCHMLLMEAQSPDDVINTFRLIASAYWFLDANQFLVVADRAGSPVATYNTRHLVDQNAPRLGRDDIVDRPNRVIGYFTDVTNKWQRTKVPGAAVETAAVTSGLEEPIEVEYELPWIHDAAVARSRLVYILNSHQFDGKLSVPWMAATADRQLGDIVTQNVPARGLVFTGRLLRRMKDMATNTFDVVLHEYNAAKYNYDPVSNPAKTPSTLPDPSEAPTEVTGFSTSTIFEVLYQEQPGQWKSRARLAGNLPNFQWLDAVEIYISINGGAYLFLDEFAGGPGTAFDVVVPTVMEIGVPYNFKLVVRSQFQQRSAGVIAAKTFQGKTALPSAPLWFTATQRGRMVSLAFQPNSDRDYFEHEFRRGPAGSTWSTMARVAKTRAQEVLDEPPLGTHVYEVRASDGIRYSATGLQATVSIFYYGPDGGIEEATEAYRASTVSTFDYYGDAGVLQPWPVPPGSISGGARLVMEGVTAKAGGGSESKRGSVTVMMFADKNADGTSRNPTVADAEISANGYTSLQQWNDLLEAPRRKSPDGVEQGIWAPINGTLRAILMSSAGWGGDGNGWRNANFKFRLNGTFARLGLDIPDISSRIEAVLLKDLYLHAGSASWGDDGANILPGLGMSSNDKWGQTIFRGNHDTMFGWRKEQSFPSVVNPVDLVTNASGEVSVTYAKPMLAGQVPAVAVQVLNGANATTTVTALSNTALTVKALVPGTGAPAVVVTLRISAEDRGGGGTTFTNIAF